MTSRRAPASPPLDEHAAGRIVDAVAPMIGIAVDPEWRAGVVGHLRATVDAARLVADFPLEDELEPAPVFRA